MRSPTPPIDVSLNKSPCPRRSIRQNWPSLLSSPHRKGAKQLPTLYTDGGNVVCQLDEYAEVVFEPSAFNDAEANRVTLCVTPTEAVCETIAALDNWCIDTLSANPVPLLGVQLTPEQVRDRYVSCLKTSPKGYQTLRAKMNRSGRYALQCYTPDKEKRVHPETWRGCMIRPRLLIKGIWIMGKDFGDLLECSHVVVKESGDDEYCPF